MGRRAPRAGGHAMAGGNSRRLGICSQRGPFRSLHHHPRNSGYRNTDTNGPIEVDGVSLLEHVKSGGRTALPDRFLFWDLWGKQAALHGPWKIAADTGNHNGKFDKAVASAERAEYMLVNLDNDLGETIDLRDKHPEIYSDLKERLIEWLGKAVDFN